MKTINVRVLEDAKEFDDLDEIIAEVKKNEILEAKLHEETEEYFAEDSQGREWYVGELDVLGNLKLSYGLELIEN